MATTILDGVKRHCGHRRGDGLVCGRLFGLRIAPATILALLVAACAQDSRISVYEFLEMEHPSSVPPATQPVGEAELPMAAPEPWSAGGYRVGPDDVLTVVIAGLEAIGLPNTYTVRVNRQGQLVLPSIGAVAVGGMTLDEVEAEIQKQYSPQYIKNAQVAVQVASYGITQVLVLGDIRMGTGGVTTPMVQLRRDQTSVLQAVLAAGGPVDFGGSVTLIPARSPQQPMVFDMSNRNDLARAARPGVVQESDLLIVDNRPNDAIYVLGLVNNPGPVPMPRAASISALQALGAAGGTLLAFEPKDATLLRRRPNGELIRVKMDLHRLLQGQDPDIRLAAGDVLLVPHNADTRIEELIARNLVLRFGVDGTFNPWSYYYFRKDQDLRKDELGGGDIFSTFGRLNQFTGGLTPVPMSTTGQ